MPSKDRMTLEAMTTPLEGRGLCVKTPSSGAHHVCPTAQDDLDEAKPEGTEWARTKSWDFCAGEPGALSQERVTKVPAAPEDKIKALEEVEREQQAGLHLDLIACCRPPTQRGCKCRRS